MSEINFLPPMYVRQQAQRRRGHRQLTVFLTVVICLAGWWVVQRSQTATLRRHADELMAEAEAAREQETELTRLRAEFTALSRQVKVRRELAQPVSHTQVLAVLGQALPQSVSLVHLDVAAVRPEPAKPKKEESRKKKDEKSDEPVENYLNIVLGGMAPDDLTVANIIGVLSEHALFRDVMLRHSRATAVGGQTQQEFELTMTVDLRRTFKPTAERREVAFAW